MHQKKFELVPLPSLKDLESRAEKQLSDDPESKVLRITEIICPILERFIDEHSCLPCDKRSSARIQVMGEKIACERHSIEISENGRKYSLCRITQEGCPYSTLPSYKELLREKP
ncbi:MAG TPA: hypothetical protein VJH37_01975 [Candidatus Nanoarchaeia archaeon]|nr:hypothetical protein [Candidatus Nanoarchaeia archaeon]